MAQSIDAASLVLADHPRPSVAVDVAVLTVRDDALHVVVVPHRLLGLALPGTFLQQEERLADAATRVLRDKAGLPDEPTGVVANDTNGIVGKVKDAVS